MLDVMKATRKQLNELPLETTAWDCAPFDGFIILPTRKKGDSTKCKCMDFVGCRKGQAIVRLSGWSDALRLDGDCWNADCLPSLLLYIWNRMGQIEVSFAGSDFRVEVVAK